MGERRLEYLPVADLVPARRNPKDHDLDGLMRAMRRFGFLEPVTLDERTGRLIGGHGRQEALGLLVGAEAEGAEPPEGILVDGDGRWLVPVTRGWSSRDDDEADAALVGLNGLTEAGGWKRDELAEMLADVARSDAGLDGTGYTAADLEDLLANLGGPPSLDDLAETHGEPDPSLLWPVLRFKVPPDLRDRFLALVGPAGDDVEQFRRLLDLADRAS